MSISAGYTAQEIREFVHEYCQLPHGQKGLWLKKQPFSYEVLSRWRVTVLHGDLDRGLIPREGRKMITPAQRPNSSHRDEAARGAREVGKLQARVRELEQTNEALGKAIGLLHELNEQEPDDSPPPPDRSSS